MIEPCFLLVRDSCKQLGVEDSRWVAFFFLFGVGGEL